MDMQLCTCPNCGASLAVAENVLVLRCSFCGTRSQISPSESSRALVLLDAKLNQVLEQTQQTMEGVSGLKEHIEGERERQLNSWQERMDGMKTDTRTAARGCLLFSSLALLCIPGGCAAFYVSDENGYVLLALISVMVVAFFWFAIKGAKASQATESLQRKIDELDARKPL
ncbi:MAG: hypothetical protein L3J82_05620 [Planctomycetes bacterium]|nr:hypothetical protein [Planctomycetota bacterium]